MKKLKTDYQKIQASGMYLSESQKLFIDNLVAENSESDFNSTDISELACNLYKILSKIPSKKVSCPELGAKGHEWYNREHPSSSNFTISPPKAVEHIQYPSFNISSNPKTIYLLLRLQSSTFNSKDYLNYRYLNKRNASIHYYYEYIKKLDSEATSTEWRNFLSSSLFSVKTGLNIALVPHIDYRKLAIDLDFGSDSPSIILIAGYDDNELDFNRKLTIKNNCIRHGNVEDISLLPLTPTYNSLVLEDSNWLYLQEVLSKNFGKYENLSSAVHLIRVWLENDESNTELLGQFPYELIALHVCLSRKLSENSSNYQIFTSFLHFIANFDTNFIYAFGSDQAIGKKKSDYVKVSIEDFPVLLVDDFNILFRCFISFNSLVCNAKDVLAYAQNFKGDPVYFAKYLFSRKIPLCTRFSYILRIDASSIDRNELKVYSDKYEESAVDSVWGLTNTEMAALSVRSILRLALHDRIHVCSVKVVCNELIVMIDYNMIYRAVDKGVVASGDLAKGYTKFWRGLAETRLFAGHQPLLCVMPSKLKSRVCLSYIGK